MSKEPASIRGVLFDVDGTLYHAKPMRRRMLLPLLALPLRHPFRAGRTLRIIKAYREALEQVREEPSGAGPIAERHCARAATLADVPVDEVQPVIDEWLHTRPLPHLRACRQDGLLECLTELRRRGVHIGFFSDYPVARKLEALEIHEFASLSLDASDPAINAYKPDPTGLHHACAQWNLTTDEVLYVGDRPEVDAAGAQRAAMRCAIVGPGNEGSDFIRVSGFADLSEYLKDRTG